MVSYLFFERMLFRFFCFPRGDLPTGWGVAMEV